MHNKLRRPFGRISILFLLVSALVVSAVVFSSCASDTPPTKDEILQNIEKTDSADTKNYSYVMQYFSLWGMPDFDTDKLTWVESHFQENYNYGEGLPSTFEHALESADVFLDEYFDTVNLKSRAEVTDALINSYIAVIEDPYAVYRVAEKSSEYNETISGTFGGIGIVVEYNHTEKTVTVVSVNPGSPAEASGLRAGDFILGVDGRSITEIGYLNVVNHMRGEVGTTVFVTVERGGDIMGFACKRAVIEEKTVAYAVEDGIGYIAVSGFKKNTYRQFVEAVDALKEAKVSGVIFDMRNNPGGLVESVCGMVSYIVPSDNVIVSYEFNGKTAVITSEDDLLLEDGTSVDHTLDVPIVVICNEYTASSAEIFTSAIRDYRDMELIEAKIVGKTTYKKGIMQSTYQYKDGSSLTYTMAYYNPPSGENYHGIGIKPDVTVDLAESEDTQLKTAIDELKLLINAN